MKIKREKKFSPINVTFESEDEWELLNEMLHSMAHVIPYKLPDVTVFATNFLKAIRGSQWTEIDI